ncbi:MAG TPA: PAS domain S-box protein [Terracidiphilus sp.]
MLTENPHPAHAGGGRHPEAVRPAPAGIPSTRKKTKQTLRASDQNVRKTSQDLREVRQDARESRQDARNVDQASRETGQDTRESDQNLRESRQDLRETSQDARKVNQASRETGQDTRESYQDARESRQNARNVDQASREIGQNTRESDQDARESRQDVRKLDQVSRETGQDLRESCQNTRESEQALRETRQNLRESNLALAESEEWFRLLVEGVTDYAIYMLDPQGRVCTWNVGAEHSKGYGADEALGQNYSIFFLHEDAAAGAPEQELAAAAREGHYETQAWRLRKDGTKFWALVTLTAIRSAEGELRGFAKVTRDMTAQKAAEEALRSHNAQLERYRIIVENVTDYVIFTLDVEGRINSWSPSARNILGYKAEEVMGREYSIVFTPEEVGAGKPRKEMEEAVRNGSCATESWRVRRDRSHFWASGSLTAVWDEAGKLAGFIRVARDMTAHKQIEDAQAHLAAGLEVRVHERTLQMEEAQARLAAELEDRVRERTLQLEVNMEELRRKNAAAEASALNAAHELQEKEVLFREIHHRVKNNLQVVQSLLKMEVRTLPPSEARAAIESMILRVRAMAMVHERLCQMPGLASLSLADYLRDIFDGTIASYSAEPGRIRFDLDAEDILLNLERAIPFGLLANELLSNSLKHGFPAGRKGTITVSIHRVDGAVRMVIQDNGIGLPMNFDAGSCKSMGLKLANSLAHQLGGALQFTSRQGCHVQGDFTRL